MNSPEQARLFSALELPLHARERLCAFQRGLPGMRWTVPGAMHLTLRFLGEVPEGLLPVIRNALREVRADAFSLRVRGLGLFLRRPQAVLWAGLAPCPALLALKHALDEAVRPHFTREDAIPEPFLPHITLGRANKPDPGLLRSFVRLHDNEVRALFSVESFLLFRSRLSAGGAVHSIEERYPLFPAP